MKKYEVLGIGNAVVDVISMTTDELINKMNIEKGVMQLVDWDRAEDLYLGMDNVIEEPGGAVANTIAGLGALGVRTAFIGKVTDDRLGRNYAETMTKSGTYFVNHPVSEGILPTSRSMIFVSPDGERSMNTYLGISAELGPEDIGRAIAQQAEFIILEGYLFDKDKGKQAFRKLVRLCKKFGGKAGIAISDPICVERHREDFIEFIKNDLYYVIGNEDEIKALSQVQELESALRIISEICDLVVCTRAQYGATVIMKGQRYDVPVKKIVPVDSTGAGDQFAAGFIYGLVNGYGIDKCCKFGGIAAGEVISHVGPRPKEDILRLLKQEI